MALIDTDYLLSATIRLALDSLRSFAANSGFGFNLNAEVEPMRSDV